jgi:hypothetical protein
MNTVSTTLLSIRKLYLSSMLRIRDAAKNVLAMTQNPRTNKRLKIFASIGQFLNDIVYSL